MPSRRDTEEDAISERLIFRIYQMRVTLHRIDQFQRFSSQIKVENKRFNLIFFIVVPIWHDVSLSRRFAILKFIKFHNTDRGVI